MLGNSRPFSYFPRGFTQDDLPQRQAYNQEEPKESSRNSMMRPSGRSIYMQRKEYADTLNRNPDIFQVRVEHSFICESDGQESKTEKDCVTKSNWSDGKGRSWPQEMILEIKGAYLILCDIETKGESDSIPLMNIMKTRAVSDSGAYNSSSIVTVQEPRKRAPQVFMFQCEETSAEIVKADSDKASQRGGGDVDPRRMMPDISRQNTSGFQQSRLSPMPQEENSPPADYMAPKWDNRQQDYMPESHPYSPQEEMSQYTDLQDSDMAGHQAEMERNTDIFNHVLTDLEIFMGKISQAVNRPPVKENKSKMFPKKKKSKSNVSSPHWEEYATFLQKIKYGFNLLGQSNGVSNSPSAPEYIHYFLSYSASVVPLYPQDIPPRIISPSSTSEAVRSSYDVLDPQEKNLWSSSGECWTIPRFKWPDENVPPYIPVFYDGWQPPAPFHQRPEPHRNHQLSRSNSQRFPPGNPGGPINNGQSYSPRAVVRRPEPMSNGPMSSPHPTEPPLYMRVMYNFSARNVRESTVNQGEVVQVVQKSRPWWVVRNSRNEEGNVPPNILEPVENEDEQQYDSRGQVTLNYQSTPADVKAWLEYKGFSRITVSSLGVSTGKLLSGMTKDEIRTVCPEEAGKVFFQLQAIKSSSALSESSQMYNNRY